MIFFPFTPILKLQTLLIWLNGITQKCALHEKFENGLISLCSWFTTVIKVCFVMNRLPIWFPRWYVFEFWNSLGSRYICALLHWKQKSNLRGEICPYFSQEEMVMNTYLGDWFPDVIKSSNTHLLPIILYYPQASKWKLCLCLSRGEGRKEIIHFSMKWEKRLIYFLENSRR